MSGEKGEGTPSEKTAQDQESESLHLENKWETIWTKQQSNGRVVYKGV